MSPLFADRISAGGALAEQLKIYAGRDDVVVLALPRGGVPVAWEVAQALGVKLDVLVVRRLCVPSQTKLAIGAIAGAGAMFIDRQIVASSGVSPQQLDDVLAAEYQELARCRAIYCGARKPVVLQGRTVIVVDDGVATGASMHAALTALRGAKPEYIVVAVPAAPRGAQHRIGTAADEFISVMNTPDFRSVGQYYRDFSQVSDEQVRGFLAYAGLHRRQ